MALEKCIRYTSIGHEIDLNGKNSMLAYMDDAGKLINYYHRVNLVINENKTKYT